jgi:hypothetical protein
MALRQFPGVDGPSAANGGDCRAKPFRNTYLRLRIFQSLDAGPILRSVVFMASATQPNKEE